MDLKQRLKTWLPTISFAEGKPKAGAAAVATRERALGMTFSGMMLMPNPDPVLRRLGKSIATYRDLRADAHIGGCVRRRKAAVKALAHGLDRRAASVRAMRSMESILADLPMSQMISQIMDAPFYGYQPLEISWAKVGGFLVPVAVEAKPPEWFGFDQDNRLRFLAQASGPEGELLPDRKFLLARQDATYDNPYGVPDLSRCYWPGRFKRGGFDFYVKFIEKFGTPWVVGKVPAGTDDADVEKLLLDLEAMVQDAVAAIPSDSSVDIIEAAGKGASGDIHQKFLRECSREINIALLGQDQTTEANSNRASATAGLEVTEDIRDDDAELVSEAMNQLVRWTHDLNFSGPPPVWKMWEDTPGSKELAERDASLKNAGARFTRSYFVRAYQLQEEDLQDDLPPDPAAKPVSFAEPAVVRTVPQQMAERLADDLAPAVGEWIDQVRELAARVESLEELRDGLEQLLPGLTLEQYADAMTQALAAAALAGRYDILQEVSGGR